MAPASFARWVRREAELRSVRGVLSTDGPWPVSGKALGHPTLVQSVAWTQDVGGSACRPHLCRAVEAGGVDDRKPTRGPRMLEARVPDRAEQ